MATPSPIVQKQEADGRSTPVTPPFRTRPDQAARQGRPHQPHARTQTAIRTPPAEVPSASLPPAKSVTPRHARTRGESSFNRFKQWRGLATRSTRSPRPTALPSCCALLLQLPALTERNSSQRAWSRAHAEFRTSSTAAVFGVKPVMLPEATRCLLRA